MAVDKLVDSSQLNSDLTSVANAIRTKGGTSAQMAFPAGFVSAIQAIPTGTMPAGTKQISITENGTTTEDVAAYANAEITVDVQGSGSGSGGIIYQDLDGYLNLSEEEANVISIVDTLDTAGGTVRTITGAVESGGGASGEITLHDYLASTYDNPLFTSYRDDSLTTLRTFAIVYTPYIEILVFPGLNGGIEPGALRANSALTTVDFGSPTEISSSCFNSCNLLSVLIIRSNSVSALSGTGAFTNTPFASGKSGGTLYVPQALISSYQSATNWSTILSYANNSIQAIEGSQYENYYADGTPIT